ncbi:Swi5-domain-containing protein, partial [Peziza echinospora]
MSSNGSVTKQASTDPSTTSASDQASVESLDSPTATQDVAAQPVVAAPSPREHKLASLKNQSEALERQLDEVFAKQANIDTKLKHPDDPEATVKRHIRLLHEFNEIRDVAQGLIGLIAESRGVRVQDIYPEFGLEAD